MQKIYAIAYMDYFEHVITIEAFKANSPLEAVRMCYYHNFQEAPSSDWTIEDIQNKFWDTDSNISDPYDIKQLAKN